MRTPLAENTVINNRYVVQKAINSKDINQLNYLCVDQSNGQIVLIKEFFPLYAIRTENGDLEYSRLPDDSRDKFVFSNENAQLYGKLPTISTVVDVFMANNTVYAVCEYCKGKTIREIVEKGSSFSKTTVQNTIVMLLKTNMALAKFGLCNRNFHPDNVIVTEDGYIKLREFYPGKLDVYEGESTKSIAALGFFMMTGKDTEMASQVRKHASTPREQQLIDYMLYVIDESSTVTSKEFYNAALLRFDKRSIFSSNERVESETSRKIFRFFSKKRFIALASVVAILVIAFGSFAAFKIHKSLQAETDLGFESFLIESGGSKLELKKSDFSIITKKRYEYIFKKEEPDISSKEMQIKLSLKAPENIEIQWVYNGKKQKEANNKTEITVEPSNNRAVILNLKSGTFGTSETYVIKFTSIKDVVVYTHNTENDKVVKLEDFDFTAYANGEDVAIPSNAAFVSFEAYAESKDHIVSIKHGEDKVDVNEPIELASQPIDITFEVCEGEKVIETRKYRFSHSE